MEWYLCVRSKPMVLIDNNIFHPSNLMVHSSENDLRRQRSHNQTKTQNIQTFRWSRPWNDNCVHLWFGHSASSVRLLCVRFIYFVWEMSRRAERVDCPLDRTEWFYRGIFSSNVDVVTTVSGWRGRGRGESRGVQGSQAHRRKNGGAASLIPVLRCGAVVVVVVVVVVRVSPDWHCLVCRVTAGTEETGQTRHSSPHTDGQSVLTWELRLRTEKLTQLIVNKAGLGLVREWVREWGREWGREGGFTTKHHHCQGYRTGEIGRHRYLYY